MRAALGDALRDVLTGAVAPEQGFEERRAGEAVGPVQAGAAALAHAVEAGQRRAGGSVDEDAAAEEMRHGNHRDGFLVDVDAQLHAVLVDGGEPCGDVVLHAGDVQIHAGLAAVKHFIHDCPGHNVAGGEVGAFVIALHEEFALGVREAGPFAAHGLRNQEAVRLAGIQRGRVELDVFQIVETHARALGHGDARTGAGGGVGRVQIDLPDAAGGKHGEVREQGFHFPGVLVVDVGPEALVVELVAVFLIPRMVIRGDQVHGGAPGQDADVRRHAHGLPIGLP